MPKTPQPPTTGAGSQSFSIGWEDFLKGCSTSNSLPDAGYSPSTINLNPNVTRGIMTPTGVSTIDTGIATSNYSIVATAPFIDSSSGVLTKVIGVTTDGHFITRDTASSDTWTALGSDSSGRVYTQGISDIVSFVTSGGGSCAYASTGNTGVLNDNVAQIQYGGTVTPGWFYTNFSHYLQQSVPHPMIVFNNALYIADGIYLHKFDGTNYVYQVLTIEGYNNITALGIDPNTGKMMVAYSTNTDPSHTGGTNISKVGLYDGTNPTQFTKLVIVDNVVRNITSVGGIVYMGYGNNLGYWNGSGITFLRRLSNVLYKNMTTNIGNDIYYADGNNIGCYTEIQQGLQYGGRKVFNYPVGTSYPITFICAINNSSLINYGNLNGSTNQVYTVDMTAAGAYTQTATFYSNPYPFPRPVYIRAIDIITSAALGSSDTITAAFLDDYGASNNFTPTNYIANGVPLTNRLQGGSDKVLTFQLILTMNTSVAFRRAIVYYDFAE